MGEGPDSMNFKSPISLENRVTTNQWIFSNETSQTRNRPENYPPNFPKKTSNSVCCKHTSGNRTKSANLRARSDWELHQPPTGHCPQRGAFLQPDAFSLPLGPSFFVQIQLASPVRISHLKGEVWTQISHEDLELIVTFYDL